MSAPQILLVMDKDAEEAQAVHVLSKYHFINSVERIRRVSEAMNFFGGRRGEGRPSGLPELIILSISGNNAVRATMAAESRRDELAKVPLIVVAENREEEEEIRKLDLPLTYCMGKPLGFFKLLEAMQKLGMYWVVMRLPELPGISGK